MVARRRFLALDILPGGLEGLDRRGGLEGRRLDLLLLVRTWLACLSRFGLIWVDMVRSG